MFILISEYREMLYSKGCVSSVPRASVSWVVLSMLQNKGSEDDGCKFYFR